MITLISELINELRMYFRLSRMIWVMHDNEGENVIAAV